MTGLRVAFAGTPVFARVGLEAIAAAGFTVPLVLTQPDRPAGRGLRPTASPVKAWALDHGVPVAQPQGLRLDGRHGEDAAQARQALLDAQPDVLVVAAYGLLLPPWVLALPRLGCLNIHASLLPRWRGAAPIHRAIEAGDPETGVTIMQMDEGLDTGDMLLAERLPLDAHDTTASAHDRLAAMGGRLVVQALALAASGALRPTPQPTAGVTYAHKVDKAEAQVDWTTPADALERRLRAFTPAPGLTTAWREEPLKIWAAHVLENADFESNKPNNDVREGQILLANSLGIDVQTGQGVLRLTEVQRAGGKRLPAADFLRGCPVTPGERLGLAPALAGN